MKASDLKNSGYKGGYPPSVLVIGDTPGQLSALKRQLQQQGCQVYCLYPWGDTTVNLPRQADFDLVVVDLEQPRLADQKLTSKLQGDPELASVPLVIIGPQGWGQLGPERSGRPIYDLRRQAEHQETLLQIIEQVHYLRYRYM
jgi:DNA-binding NtrC family response regulator